MIDESSSSVVIRLSIPDIAVLSIYMTIEYSQAFIFETAKTFKPDSISKHRCRFGIPILARALALFR